MPSFEYYADLERLCLRLEARLKSELGPAAYRAVDKNSGFISAGEYGLYVECVAEGLFSGFCASEHPRYKLAVHRIQSKFMEEAILGHRRLTLDEYNQLESSSEQRYEYYGSEVVAMAGGSPEHALIILNVGGEIRARLKGTACRTYSNELRIRIPGTPLHLYPDTSVICGPIQLDPDENPARTALNPRLLVEVLSPSTERRDKGEKFRRYLQIDSLEEYVLVYQDRPRVESYFRQHGGTWLFSAAAGIDALLELRSLKIQIPLSEIYAGVNFKPLADLLEDFPEP